MRQRRCRICDNPELRVFLLDQRAKGMSVTQLPVLVRQKFGKGISQRTIETHFSQHESDVVLPYGYLKWWFTSDQERQRVETAFLARMSFVFELWDKYVVLSEEFQRQSELSGASRLGTSNLVKLGDLLLGYLDRILNLQRERDVVMQVTKVVVHMLADDLVRKLAVLLSDLDDQKKELILKMLVDSVKKSLNYVKSLSKEDMDALLKKVVLEYNDLKTTEEVGYDKERIDTER